MGLLTKFRMWVWPVSSLALAVILVYGLHIISPGISANDSEDIFPASFDWRDKDGQDWMTPVKDQGMCGSCWAFATIGAMEAVYNIVAVNPDSNIDFSEEYLVSDCHQEAFWYQGYYYNFQNCCGGNVPLVLDFINAKGVIRENCLPYVDGSYPGGCECDHGGVHCGNCTYKTDGKCSDKTCADKCDSWVSGLQKVTNHIALSNNPQEIKQALVTSGPVVATMCMYGEFDDQGIYRCGGGGSTNHVVVIVGFDDGGEYWIVKNSWGSTWDEEGYFKVGYGECNIEQGIRSLLVSPLDVTNPDCQGTLKTMYFAGNLSFWSAPIKAIAVYSEFEQAFLQDFLGQKMYKFYILTDPNSYQDVIYPAGTIFGISDDGQLLISGFNAVWLRSDPSHPPRKFAVSFKKSFDSEEGLFWFWHWYYSGYGWYSGPATADIGISDFIFLEPVQPEPSGVAYVGCRPAMSFTVAPYSFDDYRSGIKVNNLNKIIIAAKSNYTSMGDLKYRAGQVFYVISTGNDPEWGRPIADDEIVVTGCCNISSGVPIPY